MKSWTSNIEGNSWLLKFLVRVLPFYFESFNNYCIAIRQPQKSPLHKLQECCKGRSELLSFKYFALIAEQLKFLFTLDILISEYSGMQKIRVDRKLLKKLFFVASKRIFCLNVWMRPHCSILRIHFNQFNEKARDISQY